MHRLLTHAAVILPVAFAGPSALAQGEPTRAEFEPTRVEMMAIFSAAVIGDAKACGTEASLLDALTEHVFRVLRAKARDDGEFHSATQYFNWTYTTRGARNIAANEPACGEVRALFGQWDAWLDKPVETRD